MQLQKYWSIAEVEGMIMAQFNQINQRSAIRNFRKILSAMPTRDYSRSETVLYQGEMPSSAMVLKNGIIRMYDIGHDGSEKTIAYVARNDLLPPAWIFKKSNTSLYYYEAFTYTSVYVLSREKLVDILESDHALLSTFLDRYLTMYIGATMHIEALEYSRAQDKVLRILQFLSIRFGEYIQKDILRINLRLTQQDIANMIGLSRETTALEIGKLKRKGLIDCQHQRYIFDEKAIARIIGIEEFPSPKLNSYISHVA